MRTERVDTLVIGGGQAGLVMSHMLTERSCPHLVLERERIGERWRAERWDGLRFQFPNWSVRLPDFPYLSANPDGFATSAEILDYLYAYAAKVKPPIRCGVQVAALHRDGSAFLADTPEENIAARNVVVATGPYQRPIVPDLLRNEGHFSDPRECLQGPRSASGRCGVDCGLGCLRCADCRGAPSRWSARAPFRRPSQAHAAPLSRARPDLVAERDGPRSDAGRGARTRRHPAP